MMSSILVLTFHLCIFGEVPIKIFCLFLNEFIESFSNFCLESSSYILDKIDLSYVICEYFLSAYSLSFSCSYSCTIVINFDGV